MVLSQVKSGFLKKVFFEILSKTFKLGVVTGRPKDEAMHVIESNDLDKVLKAVICMEDVGQDGKPNPLGINIAIKNIGSADALYVGDTIDDAKAAFAANIDFIGIDGGDSATRRNLHTVGAKTIVSDVNEILELLI